MCNIEITLGKWIMPKFEVPNGMKREDYLDHLVWIGAKARYGEITQEVKERIEYELSVIVKKGYATYFLTVQDFVNWAKLNKISVGPRKRFCRGFGCLLLLGDH